MDASENEWLVAFRKEHAKAVANANIPSSPNDAELDYLVRFHRHLGEQLLLRYSTGAANFLRQGLPTLHNELQQMVAELRQAADIYQGILVARRGHQTQLHAIERNAQNEAFRVITQSHAETRATYERANQQWSAANFPPPNAPVYCRFCGTHIGPGVAYCPRCNQAP